jgi:hypothetical protein
MKKIYTVVPFYSDGIEIFSNDVKSFTNFNDAQNYAWNSIDGKTYEIIENELD